MSGIGCPPGRVFGMLGRRQGGVAAGLPPGVGCHDGFDFNWPRGVTVSTLDSESSDRGSNPREASVWQHMCPCARGPLVCAGSNDPDRSLASRGGACKGCACAPHIQAGVRVAVPGRRRAWVDLLSMVPRSNVCSIDGLDSNWPRGVTVSTLDSESSDRGSNPREASV